MKPSIELDEKDRQIISLLQENPEISQSEIAEKVAISQPSVGVRIRKLKDSGAISHVIGVNFRKAGIYLAKVDISARNTAQILDTFKDCPLFLNGLLMAGRNNICLFFICEDIASVEALVEHHLRNNPLVKDVETHIVVNTNRDLVLPVNVKMEKKDVAPCGANCEGCLYLQSKRCVGCPATKYYRGRLW